MIVRVAMNALVMLLALLIPTGVFMALYADDIHWLWLCLPLLVFLS